MLLQDVKGRRYLITLEPGATFHTHKGRLAHDQLIGSAEGAVARTDLGQKLLVLRPTLADWVVKMPRGAQVIYPKVLALMVMAADVQPGMTVVEAGAGSGALSIALLQALAPGGRLHSFERRDFADQARRNVERWFGKPPTASSCTPATSSRASPRSAPSTGSCSTCWSRGWSCPARPPPSTRAGCWSASWPPCPR